MIFFPFHNLHIISSNSSASPDVYYSFDGSYTSITNGGALGSSYNGVATVDTLTSTGCLDGACYNVGGDGSYINIGTSGPISGSWSISVWFKGLNPTSQNRTLVSSSTGEIEILIDSSNMLSVYDGATLYQSTISVAVDSTWHHIAVTYDGSVGDYTFYVENGATSSTISSLAFNADVFTIGSSSSGHFFASYIDEFRFFPTVLPPAEIANLYNFYTRPVLTCPNVDIPVASNTCAANVILNQATALPDPCGDTITFSQVSGTTSGTSFSLGAHQIQMRATTSRGLSTTCSYTVTLVDQQAPTISKMNLMLTPLAHQFRLRTFLNVSKYSDSL